MYDLPLLTRPSSRYFFTFLSIASYKRRNMPSSLVFGILIPYGGVNASDWGE